MLRSRYTVRKDKEVEAMGNRGLKNGMRLSYVCRRDEETEISTDEVAEARKYWSCSLIGLCVGKPRVIFSYKILC